MFKLNLPGLRRKSKASPGAVLQSRLPGASALHVDSCETLAGIFRLLQQREELELRSVHRSLEQGQSTTLRAIHELQSHGYVVLSEDLHDPLAARIALTPTTRRRIGRLLAE